MIGARVVLRPRSFLETADLASALIQRHFRVFVRLLPWVLVPSLVAWAAHAFGGLGADFAMVGGLACSSVTGGVYTVLCGDLMLHESVDLRDVQRRFLRRIAPFAAKRIVSWILLFLLPALALLASAPAAATVVAVTVGAGFAWIAFLPEASLLEEAGLATIFTRSHALLRSTPGRSLAWAVGLLVVLNVGILGAELAYHQFRSLVGLAADPHTVFSDQLSFAPFVGAALAAPYVAALRFLLYIDCRTRREGWDLQVQMNALVRVAQAAPGRHERRGAA